MAKSRTTGTRAAAKSAARKTSRIKASRTKTGSARKTALKKSAKAGAGKAKPAKQSARKMTAAKARARTAASRTARRGKPAAKKAGRKAVPSAARRAGPARTATARPARKPQRVAVSHYDNADFQSGLRSYAQYRDLGIVEATDGMVRAHVLRFTEPCDPAVVSKMHFHDTDFQMVYVLKGWVKTELEGEGEVLMRQGSAWTQPPRIRHRINDYSEDAELLEIILPADFETEELAG
jgi:mannose-6-phosphate isomerase-like protein (cupin superfamily)